MSKRFGRNQKRRMREALLAGEELRKAGLQTISHSAALQPTKGKVELCATITTDRSI